MRYMKKTYYLTLFFLLYVFVVDGMESDPDDPDGIWQGVKQEIERAEYVHPDILDDCTRQRLNAKLVRDILPSIVTLPEQLPVENFQFVENNVHQCLGSKSTRDKKKAYRKRQQCMMIKFFMRLMKNGYFPCAHKQNCTEFFDNEATRARHCNKNHMNTDYKCSLCKEGFARFSNFQDHLIREQGQLRCCPNCNKTLSWDAYRGRIKAAAGNSNKALKKKLSAKLIKLRIKNKKDQKKSKKTRYQRSKD